MIGTYRALLTRALGRLASERVALIATLIAIVALALGASRVAVILASLSGEEPDRLAATLRSAGWEVGSSFFDVMLPILAILMGLTFLNRDRTAGTVFGVLARPVSRTSVFLSGWAATALLVAALDFLRSGLLIAGTAWIEKRLDPLHLLGVVAGLTGTWLLLTAFFAASALLRPGYAALAGFVGLYVSTVAFGEHSMLSDVGNGAIDAVGAMLPLGIQQSTIVRNALQGTTADFGPVVEVVLYRTSWIALLLFVGAYAYSRRDLSPRD